MSASDSIAWCVVIAPMVILSALGRDAGQAEAGQVDHRGRLVQPLLQHRDEGLAAGQRLGLGVGAERLHRVGDAARLGVGEIVHRAAPYSAAMRGWLAWMMDQIFSRRRRHVEVAHAVIAQRVHDRVDHRRRAADRAHLAARPSSPAGCACTACSRCRRVMFGTVVRARHRVVHERAGHELALLVIDRVLHQRLADALRHAALHLALDDHRVDDPADIVHRGEVHHLARCRCRGRSPPRRYGSRPG